MGMHGMKEIFCIGLGAGASPFAGWQQTIASQPWNNIARNFSSQLHDTTQCSIHHLLQWSRDIVIFQVFSWCCCCCSGAFVLYLNLIHFLQNQDGKLSVKKLPEAQQNPASFSSASPNQNPRPAISKTDSKYMLLLAVIETRPEIITTIHFLSGNFSWKRWH